MNLYETYQIYLSSCDEDETPLSFEEYVNTIIRINQQGIGYDKRRKNKRNSK